MNLGKGTKILVIAAHPDDEVLACGGTIARAIDSGATVYCHFLGEGISSRFTEDQYDSQEFKEQTEIRMAGTKQALDLLGVQKVHYSNRLCAQFDKLPILSIVKEIEAAIEEFKPDVLLTHNPVEVNIDHRVTYHAVEIACRPTGKYVPKEVYTFEIICSGSWMFDVAFKPNTYVDVGDYYDKKIAAWHCYEGEAREYPFPRSDKGIESLVNYRGVSINVAKAEAFRLVRKIV